jgi:hypothetical protein
MVTGIGDLDPMRWPGSKWRCLLVSFFSTFVVDYSSFHLLKVFFVDGLLYFSAVDMLVILFQQCILK